MRGDRVLSTSNSGDQLQDGRECRLCGNRCGNRVHQAREMMFGTREVFTYLECGACGCLQLAKVPEDLGRHYPPSYYSLRASERRSRDLLRLYVNRKRAAHVFDRRNLIGWTAAKVFGEPDRFAWLKSVRATFNSRIADVGCGSGALLRQLRADGFRNLSGFDPNIAHSVEEPALRIHKAEVTSTCETFDLIMLHHSLEHMPGQLETMRALRRTVDVAGMVIIRIPVVGWAWRRYGVDWVQLDAPRHVVLHTRKSLCALARQCGFAVERIQYDSTEFQVFGSERYRKDIPLIDPRMDAQLTRKQVLAVRAKVRALNASAEGDQACFFLRPT